MEEIKIICAPIVTKSFNDKLEEKYKKLQEHYTNNVLTELV